MCTQNAFPIQNDPKVREVWNSIDCSLHRFSDIICAFVDNSLSNFRKYALDPHDSRKVRIVLRDDGCWVNVDVIDTGTGIRDIHTALTPGCCDGAESPLNEHGMGLKQALACFDYGCYSWSIQTRTPEDNQLDRYLLVEVPRSPKNAPFMGQYLAGTGKLIHPTGTAISFRCSHQQFDTLRPAGDRAKKSFYTLTERLVEELGFIYAQVLQRGEMTLEVDDGLRNRVVRSRFPLWDKNGPQEIPGVTCDLGVGPVELVCRYGLLRSRKEPFPPCQAPTETGGVEIRCNGRMVQQVPLGQVWNGRSCPRHNRFLVQVDLRSQDWNALPPTNFSKTGFWEGDFRLEALYAWLRANVPLPAPEEPEEERLVEVLARNKAVEAGVIRVARKEDTYRSLDLGVKMDLFVSYQGKSEAYEAKMGCSRPLDVYVLRMYWDGCALDGRPLTQGVLIARHHSREAAALVEQMNSITDPTGRPYRFCLTTWEDEGIDPDAV